jgi:opacity protein-like surface antigen
MNMNFKKIGLIAFTGLSFFSANAQTADKKLAIGFQLGLSEYAGDLGNGFGQFSMKSRPIQGTIKGSNPGFAGMSLAMYVNPYIDLALSMNVGEWGYYLANDKSFNSHFMASDLSLRYKLLGERSKKVQPYLLVGVGARSISRIDSVIYHSNHDFDNEHQREINLLAGIGLKINMIPNVTLTLQTVYGMTNNDKVEGSPRLEHYGYDQFLNHSIGISYQFDPIKVHNHIHEKVSKLFKK